jgi:hypothetical protein
MDGRNHYQKYILTIWQNRHKHERTFPCFAEHTLSPLVLADAKTVSIGAADHRSLGHHRSAIQPTNGRTSRLPRP